MIFISLGERRCWLVSLDCCSVVLIIWNGNCVCVLYMPACVLYILHVYLCVCVCVYNLTVDSLKSSPKCFANSCSHLCSYVLWISSANLSWKKLENSAYFTFRVNGNKIPQWMSADVFDTNSHFPICCLIEHDEWLESEKRRDKWQHLGSIACPIDSPSLLLLQPSWLLCPPHKPFLGGGIAS